MVADDLAEADDAFLAVPVAVSAAPDVRRRSFEVAVAPAMPAGTGVDEPDGVLVLVAEAVDGERVRPFIEGAVNFLAVGVVVPLDLDAGTDLLGIRLGVPSSELANERLEPCLLGGLLPWRLAGLDPGRLPPGVAAEDRLAEDEPLRTGVRAYKGDPSVSDSESGVPVRPVAVFPIGTLRALRSRTFVMGP